MADATPTPLRVLIAAARKPDQLMLQRKLQGAAGWSLKTEFARNPEEALARLQETPVDLVLIDSALGADTLPKIRQLHAKTAVVVVAERGEAAAAVEAMKRGAMDYLTHAELAALDIGNLFHRLLEVRNLTAQNLELRQINQMKNEFIANISHELRTPLQVIVGYARAIYDETLGPLSAEQAKACAAILQRTEDLITTINQILSTRDNRAEKLLLKPLELRGWLARYSQKPHHGLARKSLSLEVSLPPPDIWILADSQALEGALDNLLSNAFKFAPNSGRVTLAAARSGEGVTVSVGDEGAGIAPELLGRLFEKFSAAAEGPVRSHAGLGLGLPLAREIVELHDGRLWVESAGTGKGATAHITLPVARRDSPERWAQRSPALEKKRILIVEDNPDLVEVLRLFMSSISPNLTLTAVTSGFEALRVIETDAPHLVILDVMMPGISGLEVIERLRRNPAAAKIPVLVLTGYPDAAERALGIGAKDVLLKPFEKEIFVKKVMKLLNGPN